MHPQESPLDAFVRKLIEALLSIFSKTKVAELKHVEEIPAPDIKPEPHVPVDETPIDPPVEVEKDRAFLKCPIKAKESGQWVTPFTVKISCVIDHSSTALDTTSSKTWGLHAKDQKVKAFNGEIGDGEASGAAPFGYTKQTPAPFFANKEINYVGAAGFGDTHPPTHYLNYDGHAGYDFPYPAPTPIVAPADGILRKASNSDDNVYGQGWDVHHTFYIKHPNGYSTWFRHVSKLEDDIEEAIGTDFSKGCEVSQGQVIAYVGNVGNVPFHLHFETKDAKNKIVDPYSDGLWQK